jgi:hypothetical protein
MEKLIIVPGHASFRADTELPLPHNFEQDKYWALKDFQHGEPHFYVEHIRVGLELSGDNALLIFSGGRTKLESGEFWSEARTYDEIAKTFPNYPKNVALEEYARDSLQNLDFSIRKFVSLYGHQPSNISVVGWAFKESRFNHHAEALGLPPGILEYIGANNPSADKLTVALEGEAKIVNEFTNTPLGNSGSLLERRQQRDPYHDGEPKDY